MWISFHQKNPFFYSGKYQVWTFLRKKSKFKGGKKPIPNLNLFLKIKKKPIWFFFSEKIMQVSLDFDKELRQEVLRQKEQNV